VGEDVLAGRGECVEQQRLGQQERGAMGDHLHSKEGGSCKEEGYLRITAEGPSSKGLEGKEKEEDNLGQCTVCGAG